MRRGSRSTHEPIAQRLLEMRSRAGSSLEQHARYHALVNRYQRVLMRNYLVRYRFRLRASLHLWRRMSHRLQHGWQRLTRRPALPHRAAAPRTHSLKSRHHKPQIAR